MELYLTSKDKSPALTDYQREILDGIIESEHINPVVIGRKNGKLSAWFQYMYEVIYGVTPTYNELVEFTHDVLTDGRKVKTETRILTFSIGSSKERTIADVKKDIKHEKNPMRLKQLNKELNKLYREKKRRGNV